MRAISGVLLLASSAALAQAAEPFLSNDAFLRDLGALHLSLKSRIQKSAASKRSAGKLTHEDALRMVLRELEGSGVPEPYARSVFTAPSPEAIDAIVERYRHPKKVIPHDELVQILEERVSSGARFYQDHKDQLSDLKKTYGVDPFLIVGIVGVETRYGSHTGRVPVFDALYTAILRIPGRSQFAALELAHFIKLCHSRKLDPHAILGSYAGAFGYAQFMPHSFNAYAVDYDKDGKVAYDEWPDVLASVANYLKENGYSGKGNFGTRSRDWLSIYAYNHSDRYVREVLKLRRDIMSRTPGAVPDPKPKAKAPKKKKTKRSTQGEGFSA
jgi:membrane-bound lytic murein transglycosylase B